MTRRPLPDLTLGGPVTVVAGMQRVVEGVEILIHGMPCVEYVLDSPVVVPAGCTFELVGLGEGKVHYRVNGFDEVRTLRPAGIEREGQARE